jgi:hypothetical protein
MQFAEFEVTPNGELRRNGAPRPEPELVHPAHS